MDGMTFGELMNAMAELDPRLSGLTPTIGPAEVDATMLAVVMSGAELREVRKA